MLVEPDPLDYDPGAEAHTEAERGRQHRLACARKLIRLFHQWNAGQT